MKNKTIFSSAALLLALTLSACGAKPAAPAMSVEDIQNTAIAQAWAIVTQTQAALPSPTASATPQPPTETPAPLPTIALLLPTLSPLQPTAAALPSVATKDPCGDVAPLKPNGTTVQVKFVNKAEAPVDLHFGMNFANDKGECGIYYFSLGRYDQPIVTVLAGCYWAYAYVHGTKTSDSKSVEALCITDPARTQSIWIGKETIGFH
ncbi:MAG: hypothetical protein Fur002_06310 [Anaerolineales bacterium]